jgi:hypothetical protein
MAAHPLRFIIPPLVVIAAILAVYIPIRRHALGERHHPHNNPHKPVHRVTATSVIACGLIAAFILAFILP